ncbi:nuclear transport factor 2 family protein [Mariniflexile sp.]|uniref:nuclear transport factor 2 family protein n=1 Tax=Mariniflexile sp. TaxID=1979402 RepID=UPI004047B04D
MTQTEQILECEIRLLEAMKSSDIKVLDELIHDNLIFNLPTGQTITKSMDIENYRSGNMSIQDISTSDYIIVSIETITTVAVTMSLKARYANQIIEGNFRYLRVWKLFDKSWKIIAGSGFLI